MKRRVFVVVAGVQPEVLLGLADKFEKERDEELIPLRRVRCPYGYTEKYVTKLYARVADELRSRQQFNRETLLINASLTVLFVDWADGSECTLYRKFGVEALVVPFSSPEMARRTTSNDLHYVVNSTYTEIKRALKRTRAMYNVISEEVTNRDSRTCLLLPPKTFGRRFDRICEGVRAAAKSGEGAEAFRKRLQQVANSLPIAGGRHFAGDGGLVFRCPAKARGRHGLAPLWGDGSHALSCVIRGRLRFGASFDPRFHYDCDVNRRTTTVLPGCHEHAAVDRRRRHVNVAPNDNVR